jgi:ketosteroid isomerase-like protein
MPADGPRELVAELWRRIEARDWDGVGCLLAEDFVLDWPHARARFQGRAAYVDFNRRYPEGWSIHVLRVIAEGDVVVSEVRVPHPTVGPHYALSIFEIEGGLIRHGREYWVEEREDRPPDRERWLGPMPPDA